MSLLLFLLGASWWAFHNLPATADPATVEKDRDFAVQGEYAGAIDGEKLGIQVVALGRHRFEAVICPGGLPGDGWDGEPPRPRIRFREKTNGSRSFGHSDWIGILANGEIRVKHRDTSKEIGVLRRAERASPTLGAPPPDGAIALFDGTAETAARHWKKPRLEGDLLRVGQTTREEFGDCRLHLEFRLPWKPDARGQQRGNSGVYLAGRYEVQVLDSFGRRGKDNECGGIYGVAEPEVNLCYPPLRWQTYDIDFTAPRFDEAGKKTANARVTVRHNGVVIHRDLEIPRPTGLARLKGETAQGPLVLQNHGNPVRFRNIWVLER